MKARNVDRTELTDHLPPILLSDYQVRTPAHRRGAHSGARPWAARKGLPADGA